MHKSYTLFVQTTDTEHLSFKALVGVLFPTRGQKHAVTDSNRGLTYNIAVLFDFIVMFCKVSESVPIKVPINKMKFKYIYIIIYSILFYFILFINIIGLLLCFSKELLKHRH